MAAFDEMKAWIKEAKEINPEPLTDCPECGWSLSKNEDGQLHCPFCGWPNMQEGVPV
uniref:Uncharacterized protein n=1 Tax=viral metagenome TaxID=1070528 RepID=A0A6H1ZPR7_9ZZZZ